QGARDRLQHREGGGRHRPRLLGRCTLTSASPSTSTLIIVGNPGVIHIGGHLFTGAGELGYSATQLNSEEAFSGNRFLSKMNWRMRGHQPNQLRKFSLRIVQELLLQRHDILVSTGVAPIDENALREIGDLGVIRCNYLTDDPWNPAHRAPWFLRALPLYDHVFSPRRSNIGDLRKHGCPAVSYLPFAYA